jgi:hypothetical protein
MTDRQNDNAVYSSAQARSALSNALDGVKVPWVRRFAGMVDDRETLDFLNHMCSLYEDIGENYLETREAEIVLQSAATHMADEAFADGNVSQLQGIVGLRDHTDDASDALAEIVRRLSQEGTIAVVTGPPGAGKTSATLDISRAWGAWTGGRMFGVTSWDGFDAEVSSDVEMLEEMASFDGPALGILDETMQELTGRGADVEKAEAFADRGSLIRKSEAEHGPHAKRGSLLLVSHVWDRMNKPTREMATLVIQKPSRSDPGRVVLWESDGGEDTKEKIGEFVGLTDTRENYPEHEASSFRIVLDGDDDGTDDVDAEDVQRDGAIKTAIRANKPWSDDDGMSYADIAKPDGLVEYKDSWVGKRVREWKRGEHRDLVADPSDGTE